MKIQSVSNNIFTIDSFLSDLECSQLIEQAESVGFAFADVDTGSERTLRSDIRDNERVDWRSEELASEWWNRISPEDLPTLDGMRPFALSPYFRFYKYSPEQKFNMHKDGRQKVAGGTTMLTLLVYLNEGYLGGTTNFRQDSLEVVPSTGMALLFEHHLWHQGVKLKKGVKYVLRTDVAYKSIHG